MVYVDDMLAPYRGMKMCHMLADTHEELVAMAKRIGVQLKWIQNAGAYNEHFDICLSKKRMAVKFGAKEIEYGKELAVLLERKEGRHGLKNTRR